MTAPAKKRKTEINEDYEDDTAADQQASSGDHNSNKKNHRNERKRQLEKKRRDEVNNGLDKMMELLFEIDPKSRAESRERQMGANGTKGGSSEPAESMYNSLNALNRVDLIHRSTELLRTLHYENQDLKKLLAELSASGGSGVGLPASTKPAPNVDLLVAPPLPQIQMPRLAARASLGDHTGKLHHNQHDFGGGGGSGGTLHGQLERSESAPVALLNALREQRQSLIDKQRTIDASLELIRSGRLNNNNLQPPSIPTPGPRREVSLDFGVSAAANNLAQRQAAASRREEQEIRLARFTSSLNNNGVNGSNSFESHQETAHVLANLRKNQDDLLEDGSEQSGSDPREDPLAALRQQVSSSYHSTTSRSHNQGGPELSNEDLLARIRNSQAQLANRERLLSHTGLGGSGATSSHHHSTAASASMSGHERFLQFQQDNQRLAERLALEARMPDVLARSRTLDPALLLRHHQHGAGLGGGGGGQRRMY